MSTRVSVDVVVLTLAGPAPGTGLHVLLTGFGEGGHGLPGAVLEGDEDLEAAAQRVMSAVGLTRPRHVEQLASFGAPDRTPPPRTVAVTYLALVPSPFPAAPAAWHPVDAPIALAFDHGRILATAVGRVRSKLAYSTIAYGLLPDEFTLSELQDVYEAVLATSLDKRNFRKKVQALGLVEETGGLRRGQHRPAALHRFTSAGLVLLDEGPLV